MKKKVSNYIADFLVEHGISDVFSLVGGSAMHLNDSFGHSDGLHVTYQHHEQACSMAADAYARVTGKPAVVCVTSGPGATNAITGVMGAYIGSIPMIVFSGQVRRATSVHSSGLPLRSRGVQEFDIVGSVRNMTKYCETVQDPSRIRYCLEKALYASTTGRPGPSWLDMPQDVQATMIETDDLEGYQPETVMRPQIPDETMERVMERLLSAKRPVILAGHGIRLGGAHATFIRVVHKLGVPVVATASSVDVIASDDACFAGRTGVAGDRAGNFAVQNSDCLIAIGIRLSFAQTGFDLESWAREAWKFLVDVDADELKKNQPYVDECLCADAGDFLSQLDRRAIRLPCAEWVEQCARWRRRYPVVEAKHYTQEPANGYAFFHEMTSLLKSGDILVSSCGFARIAGSQAAVVHEGVRYIANASVGAMGIGLPFATGVCVACNGQPVTLVTGDGSIMLNIQELQTIAHHRMNLVVFVLNNCGYHSIRQTQTAYFNPPMVGVGPDSGDLSFPSMEKLAYAFNIPYDAISTCKDLKKQLTDILSRPRPLICEVFVGTKQVIEPKVTSRQINDGQMVSCPLEDMAPFLPRKELRENMYIPLMKESEWSE